MRVSMSAIVSLVIGSPRTLLDARYLALAGQAAETDAAHAETAHVGPRAAADATAVVLLGGVPRRPQRFGDQRFLGHQLFRKGMPKAASIDWPSASVLAVVTMQTSRPRSLSILS